MGDPELAAASGPSDEPEPEPEAEAIARLELEPGTIIAYALDWSWEGAERDGDTWIFVNDLGYTIGLEAAYVSTSLLALVPCEDASAGQALAALPGSLASLSGLSRLVIGTAYAAHTSGRDASAAVAELVEVAHRETSEHSLFGAGLAGQDPYCGLHLLGAPVDAIAEDGEVFDNRSGLFVGWWSSPGESERHGLEASINLQAGSVRPFSAWGSWPELAELSGALGTVALTITRYPAQAFDGVDLIALSDAEIAYEALAGVMRSAEVVVAEAPR